MVLYPDSFIRQFTPSMLEAIQATLLTEIAKRGARERSYSKSLANALDYLSRLKDQELQFFADLGIPFNPNKSINGSTLPLLVNVNSLATLATLLGDIVADSAYNKELTLEYAGKTLTGDSLASNLRRYSSFNVAAEKKLMTISHKIKEQALYAKKLIDKLEVLTEEVPNE